MITFDDIVAAAKEPAIRDLDFAAFTRDDVLNLIMQRSEVIRDQNVKQVSPVVAAWLAGDPAPGYALIERMGDEIARRAAAAIRLEYLALKPVLDELRPASVADIGCGYALFDLLFWRDFGGRLVLIDIESNEERHFGYTERGAAYSNLEVARRFLESNGVASEDIAIINPQTTPEATLPSVELAVSFLSCGYHYPASTYRDYFEATVGGGGSVILDLRRKTAAEQGAVLRDFADLTEIGRVANGSGIRTLLRRPA